jgi:alpha-tubulin suppressor-like RCC1 family protein
MRLLVRRPRSGSLVFAAALIAGACANPNEVDPALEGSRRLAVGAATACALDPTGKVYCWGVNSNWLEYGSATVLSSGSPVAVPVQPLLSLSGGWSQHRCGLTATGAICWGRGQSGQLGNGALGSAGNVPMNVSVQENWADITTGRLTSCAVNTDGDAYCWGLNQYGEVGDTLLPLSKQQLTPNRVVGGIKFSSVVAGWLHTCGVSTTGTAYCWGNNTSGQLGIGTFDTVPHRKPTPVASSLQFRKVALSARATCGVTVDDQLLCWGYNGLGQLGDGTTTQRSSPTPVASAKKWKDVAMGSGFVEGTSAISPTGMAQGGIAHACAIDDAGAAYCWGWNGAGQLGDASTTSSTTPVAVSGGLQFSSIALGSAFSCAMSGAEIYCWGGNSVGQLGNATSQDTSQPVKVLTGW